MQSVKRRKTVKRSVLILLAALLAYCALSMAASAIVFRALFPRRDGLSPLHYTFEELNPNVSRTPFSFRSGGNTLYGRQYDAADPKGLVVIVNGIGDGADAHLPEIVYFVEHGFSVATWDATGVGNSEGRGTIGLQQIRLDLAAYLAQYDGSLPVVLYGHSAGAYAAAISLPECSAVRGAVCISGFDRPVPMMCAHAREYVGFFADVQYPFLLLENVFLFGKNANPSARDAIDAVDTPVLLVGGDSDDLVPEEHRLLTAETVFRNPNVQMLLITSDRRNEHSTPWLSPASAAYVYTLADPETADKALANELDPDFMETVLEFFENCVDR